MSFLPANSTAILVAYGNYFKTTALSTASQVLFSVNIPPLPLPAIKVYFTELVLQNTTTAAVNVTLQINLAGFGFPTPIKWTISPSGASTTTTVAASSFLFQPFTWILPQGGLGNDFTQGGAVGLAAFASATGVNLYFGYELIEGWFGGTI